MESMESRLNSIFYRSRQVAAGRLLPDRQFHEVVARSPVGAPVMYIDPMRGFKVPVAVTPEMKRQSTRWLRNKVQRRDPLAYPFGPDGGFGFPQTPHLDNLNIRL